MPQMNSSSASQQYNVQYTIIYISWYSFINMIKVFFLRLIISVTIEVI